MSDSPELDITQLSLVKDLLDARTILVSEPVSDKLARSVFTQALLLESLDESKPIYVFVNSPGGSADSGFAIYDVLRFVKPPVISVCSGLCASAAVIIYLAADKGNRYSLPNSRFLLHQPSTMSRGTAKDIQITANEILRLREKYNAIVSEVTGKTVQQITADADRDFWLSASEAKSYGLVDSIVSNRGEIG